MPLQRSLYLLLGSSPIAVSRSPEEKSFGLKASGTVSGRGFVPTDRCLGGPHPSGGWLVQKSSLNDIMGKIVYVPRSVDCEKSETSEDPFCESDTLAELAHFGIGLSPEPVEPLPSFEIIPSAWRRAALASVAPDRGFAHNRLGPSCH